MDWLPFPQDVIVGASELAGRLAWYRWKRVSRCTANSHRKRRLMKPWFLKMISPKVNLFIAHHDGQCLTWRRSTLAK